MKNKNKVAECRLTSLTKFEGGTQEMVGNLNFNLNLLFNLKNHELKMTRLNLFKLNFITLAFFVIS